MADKYTWQDIGSSFLPSDVLAAVLYAQLERYDEIMEKRKGVWDTYHGELEDLEKKGLLRRPVLPENTEHNGHMYNIILPSAKIRDRLTEKLKEKQIYAYICYVPLHSSPMGKKLGYHPEMCPVTEDYGERVLRLPLYADMTKDEAAFVSDAVRQILCHG